MGIAGLSKDGKFSSRGPGRMQRFDDDAELFPAIMKLAMSTARRPPVPGGFTTPWDGNEVNATRSACSRVPRTDQFT